jgi:plasmid maintenance system antidote protein VapI
MNKVGEYIGLLIKENGSRQTAVARDIGISRQLLNYIVTSKRDLSLQLALKIESYFNLPDGKLYKMQAEEVIQNYKQSRKAILFKSLKEEKAFWSYKDVSIENLSDEDFIENTFIYLDMNMISMLFEIYQRDFIKKVWREKIVVQGEFLYDLNQMIALYYFNITDPEKYLNRIVKENSRKQQKNA